MTTQLYIAGIPVVLPTDFAVTVRRENSLFTRNGEFTYDCTLSLVPPVNRLLYGFLDRLNKSDVADTRRTAVLVADGRVYCRGTEVVTSWSESTVTLQIVSGNSELNYFIGQTQLVSWLNGTDGSRSMGDIEGDLLAPFYGRGGNPDLTYPDIDYCLPTIFDQAASQWYNVYYQDGLSGRATPVPMEEGQWRAQPYLCAVVRRLIHALGYEIGTDQLSTSVFRHVFFTNTRATSSYCEMFDGWSAGDLLTEIEKLCDCCFVVDNLNRICHIYLTTAYYASRKLYTLQNVIDQYQADIEEEGIAEHSASDISYDLPDAGLYRLERLNQTIIDTMQKGTVAFATSAANLGPNLSDELPVTPTADRTIYTDPTTGRMYIRLPQRPNAYQYKGTPTSFTDVQCHTNFPPEMPPFWLMRKQGDTQAATDWNYMINTSTLLLSHDGKKKNATNWMSQLYGNTVYAEVNMLADVRRKNATAEEIVIKIRPAVFRMLPQLFMKRYDGSPDKCLCIALVSTLTLTESASSGTSSFSAGDGSAAAESSDTEPSTADVSLPSDYDFIVNTPAASDQTAQIPLVCAIYNGLHLHRHGYLPTPYTDYYHAQLVDEFHHEAEDTFPQSYNKSFEGSLRLKWIDEQVYNGIFTVHTDRPVTFSLYDPNTIDVRGIFVIRNRRYVCREVEEVITATGRQPKWKGVFFPIDITDAEAFARWVLTTGQWDDGAVWIDDGRWIDEP